VSAKPMWQRNAVPPAIPLPPIPLPKPSRGLTADHLDVRGCRKLFGRPSQWPTAPLPFLASEMTGGHSIPWLGLEVMSSLQVLPHLFAVR
jgi:hypothetical protein